MRLPARLVALSALFLAACPSSYVYRDTWQPMTQPETYPRLLDAALALEPTDVEELLRAGGALIGYHASHRKYGQRAASVGGTHFIAVAGRETSSTSCTAGVLGMVPLTFCSSSSNYRPTRIAVFLVQPELWPRLPPHLVPPTSDIADEARGVVISRDGCSMQETWGRVSCSNSWALRSRAQAPNAALTSTVPTNPY